MLCQAHLCPQLSIHPDCLTVLITPKPGHQVIHVTVTQILCRFETVPLNSLFVFTFYDECSLYCMASSDNELERMQKETAITQFEVLSHIRLEGLRKTTRSSIIIDYLLTKIRTTRLSHKSEVLLCDPLCSVKCVINERQLQSPPEAILHSFRHVYTMNT